MAKGVAMAIPNIFLVFYKKIKIKIKIRGNMRSFGYNWSNCKNLELCGGRLQKLKLWCSN
jgi:hypothetical protein